MLSQTCCTADTPMGANLVPSGGATFRVWAPRARAVYLEGVFAGVPHTTQTPELLLNRDANGYWAGFLPHAAEGDTYRFFVIGEGSSGFKRDPYARELANDLTLPFPVCRAVIRSAGDYPWHDHAFQPPAYSDMVLYQLHIGTYAPAGPGWAGTFLDIIEKIPHLAALGINVLQPLPIYEMEDSPSQGYPGLGYQGADLYSPAIDYAVYHDDDIDRAHATINRLLAARNYPPISRTCITSATGQLKAMIDLLHVYGIAVVFDVVYNHAGGWAKTYSVPASIDPSGQLHGDDYSLYFFDRAANPTDNNQSLYFTDQGFVGGLAFAMWNMDVRGFLRHNALFHLTELHADGFRYDEISMLLELNRSTGWDFCRELTAAVRAARPSALQNAEYWPGEFGAPASLMVQPASSGGLGFDAVQHDGLREAIRTAIAQASGGANATVSLTGIAMALWPTGFDHSWHTIPCIENHDIVKRGERPRIPTLADSSNPRSWYARSRTRVAMGLLLTAPGIPQLFMAQELLEARQWCPDPRTPEHLIQWDALVPPPPHDPAATPHAEDHVMADHLHFTRDLIATRNRLPGLRAEGLNVFYVSNSDRVIAFHRWVPGAGQDVVIVASLNESTHWNYQLGMPLPGLWREAFNSDAYDSASTSSANINPLVAGNRGSIHADGPALHDLPFSATLVIPANGILVFTSGTR